MFTHLTLIYLSLKLMLCKTYTNGGQDWTEEACIPYRNQRLSPINILPNDIVCDDGLFIDLQFKRASIYEAEVSFKGNPKTLKITTPPELSTLYLQNTNSTILSYGIREIVFRTPSEHGYNNTIKALEAQMFYKIDESFVNYTSIHNIALSAIYNEVENANTDMLFSALVDRMRLINPKKLTEFDLETSFNATFPGFEYLDKVLKKPLRFFMYNGTYTDDGCEPGLTWIILEQEFSVNANFLQIYKDMLNTITGVPANGRDVYNFYDVVVYKGGDKCDDFFIGFVWFVITYAFMLYFILTKI